MMRGQRADRNAGHLVEPIRRAPTTPVRQALRTLLGRTLLGLVLVAALSGCQEDMGSEDWLIVDNRTDSEVFVTDAEDGGASHQGSDGAGSSYLGSVGAGSSGFGAGAVGRCEQRALVARAGSPDGPVVARRTAADGEACRSTWVIESHD